MNEEATTSLCSGVTWLDAHWLRSTSHEVHRKFDQPYLASADELVAYDGRVMKPLVFRLTLGRSEHEQFVFNYLVEGQTAYAVKTKKNVASSLVLVKSAKDVHALRALGWYVARDAQRVYYGGVTRKVADVPTFRLWDEELMLYADDLAFYDRYARRLEVERASFAPVPFRPVRRQQEHAVYNAYLASTGLATLPLERSLRYGRWAADRTRLYRRNLTVNLYERCDVADVRSASEDDREDLRTFLHTHPRAREYAWAGPLESLLRTS